MAFRYLSPEKLERAKQKHHQSRVRRWKKHLNKQRATNPYYINRRNLNLVRMSNRIGSKTNCLRWSDSETKEHVLKKLEICMELKEWGHGFITEATFKNGTRCDVFDITEGVIYEILCTETDEKYEEKIKKYPKEVRVMKVKCFCDKTMF